MSSIPPTRRPRRTSNGEPSLPIIPILIGVIVLGFVIGAGLSLAGRHDMTVVALASPSAAASETLAPVTPAPSEKPTPEPTAAPAESTNPNSRTSTAPIVPTVVATSRPAPRRATPRAASVRVTAAPSSAVTVAVTATPQVPRATAVPTAAAAPPPAATSNANAASSANGESNPSDSSTTVQADSAFAKLSAAVVRQYLEAVKRGDQDGAYAALGSEPGAKGATLTEQGVVDSQTHVGRIDAHAAANDNALVSVRLQTSNGPYYGQYTVHKTETGAAVIVSHSIVKP